MAKRKEWLDVLSAVKPGLANKEIIEQATHFIFTTDKVLTFNDDIAVSFPFATPLRCAVEADILYGALKNSTEEELEIVQESDTLAGTATINYKGKSNEGKLAATLESKLLEHIDAIGLEKITKWKKAPDDLNEGLKLCLFAASRDMVKDWMTCLIIKDKDIWSTDDYRVSKYTLSKSMRGPIFLPYRAADAILNFKFRFYNHDAEKGWFHLKDEKGVVLSARLFVVLETPDLANILISEAPKVSLPFNLSPKVQEVGFSVSWDSYINQQINVDIADKKIGLTGRAEQGIIKNSTPIDYAGPDIKFSINPNFLTEILKHSTTVQIENNKCLFSTGKFFHAISLPVREETE
jgi:DNA polymerase III sliding clamp (beta) subunit (PCNA family)